MTDELTPEQDARLLLDQLELDEPDWNTIRNALQMNPQLVIPFQYSGANPVHIACFNNAPLSVVQLLVQQLPDHLKKQCNGGKLPLHKACSFIQSLDVIQWLVHQYPGAVKEKDHESNLPLHLACRSNQSLEVIQVVGKQHLDAVKERNNDGKIPFQLACASNKSLKVIQWLFQLHPDSVKEKNSYGELPLHVACARKQSFKVVRWLAQQDPDAVKVRNKFGNLPLHLACGLKQSLEVIQLLARKHPNAVNKKNDDGSFPLHLACSVTQSLNVIRWLIQKHPVAAKKKQNDGDLPLHICLRSREESLDVMDLLVQQHPDAVKDYGKDGNLPLHLACTSKKPVKVIQWLAQQHPNAIKQKNNDGDLPLQLACVSNQSLEVIEWLVQQHPGATTEKNIDGNLSLHLACTFNQSLAVIDLLVQQHRNSVTERNSEGNLPLHLVCANKQSFEVIQLLAQQHPDSVKAKNNDGQLPLHLACANKQSLEVIRWLAQQHPNHISEITFDGLTPGDLAKHPVDGQSPDAKTVHWLETFESGQIDLAKGLTLAPPILSTCYGEKPRGHSPPRPVMDIDLAKPSTAAASEVATRDCSPVVDILEGRNRIKSIWNEEMIAYGSFGTVHKGTDMYLRCNFAVKAINPDFLRNGHSANVQKAKEALLTETTSLSLLRNSTIEALYAGASRSDVRCSAFRVYEPSEKGSLDNFWNVDLGRERLSPFRRRIQIALDVMTAIQFLHVGNDEIASCCHCDITSANILLKRDFTAQLINCGLVRSVIDSQLKYDGESATRFVCGAMKFERSCDICSFGVVLAELLTGKHQKHADECGTSFRFEKQYIAGRSDMPRDIKKELDPALGYDRWELPKYVQDFVDLVKCCMEPNPDDCALGDAVMEKLAAISRQCGSHKSDANNGISSEDSVLSKFGKSNDKCKFCRTFPPVSPYCICAVCKVAQERRVQMSCWRASRRHFGMNAKVDASPPLPGGLDLHLTNPVPRLFILVPFAIKSALTHPRAWLRSQHWTRYYLYFLCSHSMKAIEPPIPIIVTKCWVEKVAPVLAMSLFLLHRGLTPGVGIDLGFRESGVTLKLNSARIAEMLEAVGEVVIETGSFDFFVRLRGNMVLDAEDINLLNGDAYELIVETVGGDMGCKDLMVPVCRNESTQIFCVPRDGTLNNDTMDEHENTIDAQDLQIGSQQDPDEENVD